MRHLIVDLGALASLSVFLCMVVGWASLIG